MEKIAEAQALVEKEEFREAQRLMRPLTRMPEAFEAKVLA